MSDEFRCLSVRQPWAELIASGAKWVELRTWSTDYRGALVIAASLKRATSDAAKRWERVDGGRGECVALVDLVDVRPAVPDDAEAACCAPSAGEFAWVMRVIRRLRGPEVRGSLGLFRVQL